MDTRARTGTGLPSMMASTNAACLGIRPLRVSITGSPVFTGRGRLAMPLGYYMSGVVRRLCYTGVDIRARTCATERVPATNTAPGEKKMKRVNAATFGKCSRHKVVVRMTAVDASELFNRGCNNVYCLCGRLLEWSPIKGRVTDRKCDARCMGAVSGACDCSCGGENHGINCF